MALRLPDSMSWRIYQAYLQGPATLFRLFEDTSERGNPLVEFYPANKILDIVEGRV